MMQKGSYDARKRLYTSVPIGPYLSSINQDVSLYQTGGMFYDFEKLWRWECQSKLHETISATDMNAVVLPSCIEMILLFILGLPGSLSSCPSEGDLSENTAAENEVAENQSQGLVEMEFSTPLAPQDIKVQIQILKIQGKAEKNVTIDLVSGASITAFLWETWINSVMGCLRADEGALREMKKEDGAVPCWRRTPCKVNLRRKLLTVPNEHLPKLRGAIQVWTGWPFFDSRIVQFEINQWIQASGCLHGYCEIVEPDDYGNESDGEQADLYSSRDDHVNFLDEVDNVEEGLIEISEWSEEKWRSIMEETQSVSEIV